MNRRLSSLVALALGAGVLISLSACSHMPFRRHHDDGASTVPSGPPVKANAQGLAVEIKSSPDPVKLGETRQIDVTLILRNVSKTPARLNFTTGQTIELLLREPNNGKIIAKWSTDRIFNADARILLVNAQERLEFNEPITTRELQAGKPYTLEGYFVGYEKELRATKAIVPQP